MSFPFLPVPSTSSPTLTATELVSYSFLDNTALQVRVYRTIPLHFPKGSKEDKLGKKWRGDLNYSVRTKSDINIDALPTKEGPYYGVVLFRPWDERFSKMKTGKDKCP